MKKIIYIASFLCAALLAGCDDFLTTESPTFLQTNTGEIKPM